MKRSFVRIMSGLLVIAMLMALPVVSMAEGYVGSGEKVPTYEYDITCNHSDPASNTNMVHLSAEDKATTCKDLGYKVYQCKDCKT